MYYTYFDIYDVLYTVIYYYILLNSIYYYIFLYTTNYHKLTMRTIGCEGINRSFLISASINLG